MTIVTDPVRPEPAAGAAATETETAAAAAARADAAAAPLPPPFRALAGANLAAQCAEQIALAAVPIVAVIAFAAGPREIGLLSAAHTLPFLLLSIPLGLLADRRSRRGLMLAAEALRALSLLALVAAWFADATSLPLLALLGFVGATGTVAFTVAAPALVPSLVPHALLPRANGRIELARSLAFAAGPALAGALVGWAGAGLGFAVATALSFAAVLLLVRLPVDAPPPRGTPRHPLADIRDGAAFVWRHELLRPMLLAAIVWNLAWCVLQAAYVPHAMRTLGLGAEGVGITLACFGVGMVAGALISPRLIAALPTGRVISIGPLVSVAAAAAMVATLLVPAPVLAGLSFFLFGAGPLVWTVSTTTLRQTITPAASLGRVGAIFLTVNAGARPVGFMLGAAIGALGGGQGIAWCLVAAALGYIVQAWIIVASAVRRLERLPAPA